MIEEKKKDACPVEKHTPKSFALAVVLGIFIGLAIIVPGVSGSTVAIIFSMYAALLYSIGNIFNDFKRCFAYLLPIGIGAVIGFGGGFLVIQSIFERYTFIVICFFAGLMIGAIPALTAEIRAEKRTPARGALMGLGVLIPIAIGVISIALGGDVAGEGQSFGEIPIYLFFLYIPLGALVSATQIIPGLSATAILMAFGQFKPILNSLHLDYILENPAVIGLYLCIGGGFLIGLVMISRLFSKLIERRRGATFFLVVGLSLGSIASMFLNPDIWMVYESWGAGMSPTLEIIIGAALGISGFVGSFALTKYELKRK